MNALLLKLCLQYTRPTEPDEQLGDHTIQKDGADFKVEMFCLKLGQ